MPELAAPDSPDDASLPASRHRISRGDPAFGAIWILRVLLVATIIVPVLLGAIGGYSSYRESHRRAAATLAEAVAVAEENTTKILDTHVLVAARIDDLLGALTDDQVGAYEEALHDRIAQQLEALPQVAAAWAIDGNGRELVSARVYPVNRDLDHSGRDDFHALEDPRTQTFIWALRARSLDSGDYQPYFTVSRRRKAPDGQFRGIIVVSLSGAYFASFYNSLLGGSAQYAASVFREDGGNLARYPESAAPLPPQQRDALVQAIAAKGASGIIESGSPFRSDGSLVAYRRLANYPVYVTIGQTRASILGEWFESILGYLVVGVPAEIGLMLLTLVALRRTRREQLALAQARDAIAQRAAIEDQLHQVQKMEAVGLLTAGIAHDFNNMLTIVLGNLALLEVDADVSNPKHQRLIASAIAGCQRASALTARLLTFARSEPVDPRPVDVNELITGMSELSLRSLGNDAALEFRLADELWSVFVDPHQLENALLNLAFNARDAMAGQGCLTIETGNCHLNDDAAPMHDGIAAGDYVAIFVADTGCGMPKEVREKAFDPFFTTKTAGKGTGLGLSQVYGFVTRSGGHCMIDSEPGKGTTVKLYLPRYTGAGAADSADDGNDAVDAKRGSGTMAVAGEGHGRARPKGADRARR
jgi:signal transduction histidine kinase